MSVKTTNLAETFLTFWDLAKDKPVSEQVSLWKAHYAEPHRNVLDFYQQHYNDLNAPPEEVFARYPDVIRAIRTVSADAETVIAEAAERCTATLGVAETQGHHIVMVGRFSSNAWADVFEDVPTCFYALELTPDVAYAGAYGGPRNGSRAAS